MKCVSCPYITHCGQGIACHLTGTHIFFDCLLLCLGHSGVLGPAYVGHKTHLLASLPNSMFNDIMLEAGNWPWWKYFHHRNGQILQIKAPSAPPLPNPVVKLLPAHWYWVNLVYQFNSTNINWALLNINLCARGLSSCFQKMFSISLITWLTRWLEAFLI